MNPLRCIADLILEGYWTLVGTISRHPHLTLWGIAVLAYQFWKW